MHYLRSYREMRATAYKHIPPSFCTTTTTTISIIVIVFVSLKSLLMPMICYLPELFPDHQVVHKKLLSELLLQTINTLRQMSWSSHPAIYLQVQIRLNKQLRIPRVWTGLQSDIGHIAYNFSQLHLPRLWLSDL